MPSEKASLEKFRENVKAIVQGLQGEWSTSNLNEAAVRQVIVLRLLQAAGFDIWNPLEVVPEATSSGGGRVDLALQVAGRFCFVLELKRLDAPISDRETEKTVDYAAGQSIRWAVATDGRVWKVFDAFLVNRRSSERGVLELKLLQDNAGVFAERLYRR